MMKNNTAAEMSHRQTAASGLGGISGLAGSRDAGDLNGLSPGLGGPMFLDFTDENAPLQRRVRPGSLFPNGPGGQR